MFDKVKKFFNDVYVELQKVAWPSREELIGSTIVVIAMSVVMAAFVGVVDHTLAFLVNLLVRIAS